MDGLLDGILVFRVVSDCNKQFSSRDIPNMITFMRIRWYARFFVVVSCHSWHIQDFIPVIDSNTLEVIHIDFPVHRSASQDISTKISTVPPTLAQDSLRDAGRERIPFPSNPQEYLPDLRKDQPDFKQSTRPSVKPLHIVQPEGVGFNMNGNEVEWQKWKMHIGNYRFINCIQTLTRSFQPSVVAKGLCSRRLHTMMMGRSDP